MSQLSTHFTFRASDVVLDQIERVRAAYSFPGNANSASDAIRIALAVTCRQLDSEGQPSAGYAGDLQRSDTVAEPTVAD